MADERSNMPREKARESVGSSRRQRCPIVWHDDRSRLSALVQCNADLIELYWQIPVKEYDRRGGRDNKCSEMPLSPHGHECPPIAAGIHLCEPDHEALN